MVTTGAKPGPPGPIDAEGVGDEKPGQRHNQGRNVSGPGEWSSVGQALGEHASRTLRHCLSQTPAAVGAGQVVSPVPLRLALADVDFVGVHVPDDTLSMSARTYPKASVRNCR